MLLNIIFALITLVLVIISLVGFFLLIFGTPAGIILLIIDASKPKEKRNPKIKKWFYILFSGLPLLIITFILWAIFQLISSFLGVGNNFTEFIPPEA